MPPSGQRGAGERGGPGRGRDEPLPIRHALVASFAAIAIAFTLGLAGTHVFVSRIRSAVADITGNASPSISELSSMRSALRKLEIAIDAHVDDCGGRRACGPPPARVGELQEELRATWRRYTLLPAFPDEPKLWPRVEADLDRLNERIAFVVRDVSAPGATAREGRRIHEVLAPAFDGLDASLTRIMELDYTEGLAVARRIEALAGASGQASLVLALVLIGLTTLAAVLAIRLARRYERALRERADDLEQFAARVAHDVKSPLSAVAAALHVAAKRAPEAADAVAAGKRSVARVQRLVDDLLEFARAAAMEPRGASADLREVVDEVVGELGEVAREHGVELRVEAIEHERVACSPGVLGSIVGNLVRNAITHMGSSETRVVCVRSVPAGARQPVRIEVDDTGPGIPKALGQRVFDPFVRGDDAGAGTGLGLATVRRFVRAHGGDIGFSGDGGGTTFWLELPRSAGGAGPGPPPEGRSAAS
jgi:signal transduction histidine kinase